MNGNTMNMPMQNMQGSQNMPPVKQKPQGLYKISLWITIIAVSVSAFVCILMILLTNFHDSSAVDMFMRILFVTWQILWFGFISVLISREHEHSVSTPSKIACIVGLILCVVSLTIGIIQALTPSSFAVLLDNTKEAFSLLFYSTVFSIFALRGKSSAKNVEYAKIALVGMLAIFNIFAMILIFIGYATANEMLGRFWAVFIILALVGVVVIEILKSMNAKDAQPMQMNNYMVQSPNTMNGQPMMGQMGPMQPPYPQQLQPPYPQYMQQMNYGPMNYGPMPMNQMQGQMPMNNNDFNNSDNSEPKKNPSKKTSEKKSDK